MQAAPRFRRTFAARRVEEPPHGRGNRPDITPDLELISSMASPLRFENVAPPISASVVSMPSMENPEAEPRCPLTMNC